MTRDGPGEAGPGRLIFVLASLISAALLFSVQPMISKALLPRFGGSASVWSVAIAFFQAALLVGYLYAHMLIRWLDVRRGALVHGIVLAAGALLLPPALGRSVGDGEAAAVFAALATSIGLPFVGLAAHAPLLQAWLTRSDVAGAHDPYPLYAASNAGSFAALIAYPLVAEPWLTLEQQGLAWSIGYVVLALLLGLAAMRARPGRLTRTQASAPGAGQIGQWVFLSAVPSAALVAVTAHMSTDVAAAPFLWVLPLALYLLTFIWAFGRAGAAAAPSFWLVFALALAGVALLVGGRLRFGLIADLMLHLTGFLLLALGCHIRLAASKPDRSELTMFYLAIAFGGMLGGSAAALVAPAVFASILEYPLVLVLAALAVPGWRKAVTLALTVIAALLLASNGMVQAGKRETMRSFYGVHGIEETADGRFRILRHGLEVHGVQRIADDQGRPLTGGKPQPLAYYHEDSPISEAIDAVRERLKRPLSIGIVGLGTGAIACLADPGDRLTFYEIDPVVIGLAQDRSRFRFLSDCGVETAIVAGDARRQLVDSPARYDLLIVDAFASDAIPVHLLTREALALYRQRITDNGMILLHLSNDHLDLDRIVAATARVVGLSMHLHDEAEEADAAATFRFQAKVAVLTARDADLGPLASSDDWARAEAGKAAPWSDGYSSLLPALMARFGRRD